jgi:hypothetical protein
VVASCGGGWEVGEVVGEFGREKGRGHIGERRENEENQVFSFHMNFMLLANVSSFDLLL